MKTYKILYLSSAIITLLLFSIGNSTYYNAVSNITSLYLILGIPVLFLAVITSLIVIFNKKEIADYNLIMPYLYLGFMLFIICIIYLYNALGLNQNNYVRVYYQVFLLIPFIVLSIYTIMLFKKEKN